MVPLFRIRPEELEARAFDEIIDVRSPSEFAQDHLPGAINLPVLGDEERERIGTLYHLDSPFRARREGAALITRNAAHHLDNHFAGKEKTYRPLLYCWRGGQRSFSLGTILQAIGWPVTILDGGYKAWRRHLAADLAARCETLDLLVVGGLTGAGKTALLHALAKRGLPVLDLEHLANHRGSVLGDEPGGQPAQRLFESRLHQAISALPAGHPVAVESESPRIGDRQIPPAFWAAMQRARYVELDVPVAVRAARLIDDYPHFRQDTKALLARLDTLARHRGRKTVDRWSDLVGREKWTELVESLLHDHYDLGYLKALRRHHGEPDAMVAIPTTSPDDFLAAVEAVAARLGVRGP